ncbi:MAG: endonuclease/exonuclease/phosphatase family protein [Bryobacteraceae bacterium]
MPTTKFLFWNINRKAVAQVVAELAMTLKVDVVILAESAISPSSLLATLNSAAGSGFHLSSGVSKGITILTRFSREFLRPVFESDHVSMGRLMLPARSEILLAAVHLPSKLYWSNESQSFECVELARRIAEEEDRLGHQRTVLVGDMNMNPFEPGLVSSIGLNAVTSRRIAERETRTVQGRAYRLFYNPMWGHFGDVRGDTAGSYFYDSAEHLNYFWNVFDQVLLRPELAKRFNSDQLSIVKSVGARFLVRGDGRPDATLYSDHLPIVFELDF